MKADKINLKALNYKHRNEKDFNKLTHKNSVLNRIKFWEDSESDSLSENTILNRFKINDASDINTNIVNENSRKAIIEGFENHKSNEKNYNATNNLVNLQNSINKNIDKKEINNDGYYFVPEDYPENNVYNDNGKNTIRLKNKRKNEKEKELFSQEEKEAIAKYNLNIQENREKKIIADMKKMLKLKKEKIDEAKPEELDYKSVLPDENDLKIKEYEY